MDTQRRLLLAILLMILAVLVANVLFPPPRPPLREPVAEDTVAGAPGAGPAGAPERERRVPGPDTARPELERRRAQPEAAPTPAPAAPAPPEAVQGDTIVVRSGLAEYRFSTRGAALVSARMRAYESYAPGDPPRSPVELVRPGDRLLAYRLAVGTDTLSLRNRLFESDRSGTIELTARDSLVFRHPLPGGDLAFVVVYGFDPERYLIHVRGRFEGIGDRGYVVLTGLGSGLRTNEANPREDHSQLAYVVHERGGGYTSRKLSSVEPEEAYPVEGGPFRWVAVKSKYFLAALVSDPASTGFGGLLVRGRPDPFAADMEATLPVPAGAGEFRFEAFVGPQDYSRLAAVGQDLQNVNPYGWRWLRPIIRPLVGLIMAVLVWMHTTFSLAYGWVLIVFGVLMRVVLFPLYQKSMRAQLAQMQVQPLMKELQTKYKDDPQKLQQEMVKLYREHNINPVAGCLPMMLPFPVLITLFFVFQNTIEFRGVPFLWLPDLSLKDPYYIIPILMGLSMFLLQWIGQRGMEPNPQMKIMGYALPLVFTFLFMNFPSGLNLYYATSNFASLPQQFYLSRERRKARAGPAPA